MVNARQAPPEHDRITSMNDTIPGCQKSSEIAAVREEVIRVYEAQKHMAKIQENHAEFLKILAEERLANATYKAKLGGVVLATGVIVSALWALVVTGVTMFLNSKG